MSLLVNLGRFTSIKARKTKIDSSYDSLYRILRFPQATKMAFTALIPKSQ